MWKGDEAKNTVKQVGKGLEHQIKEFVTEFPMAPKQALSGAGAILVVI